ncbi:MAG: ABC transporter permease [Bacteroidales bacterium]
MKRFWGFIIKEFRHILRDYRTLLVLFGMPVAQMLIFGFVITNEIKDANIAILDYSNDNITQKITRKLVSSGYFRLTQVLHSDAEIEACFKSGKAKEVIVFAPQFAQRLERDRTVNVQLLADASDANQANLITSYTSAILAGFTNELNGEFKMPMQIVPEVRMLYNEELKGAFMFVPGTMAMILMLISALMTSISIVREKETGTMEVLLVSPLKPRQIILGKVLPYVLLSFLNAIVIILLSIFVFQVPVRGSILLLLAESFLFITLALSLGIFISTNTNSQQTAMFISMLALLLPTILLSGFIFPVENMPLVLQWLCQVMPPKWFITIIKGIMLKGLGIGGVWKETLVLTGMTLLFIVLSIKRFKIRLEA